MTKGGGNPIAELFREELTGYASAYQRELQTLLSKPTKDALDRLIPITHAIKGSAKLAGLEAISRFADALKGSISRFDGEPIQLDEERLALLLEAEGMLAALTSSKEKPFDDVAKSLEEKIGKLTKELADNSSKAALPGPSAGGSGDFAIGEEEKKELFKKLASYADILNRGIGQIKSESSDENNLEEMRAVANKVAGLGKSLALEIVTDIGNALKNCLLAALKKQLIWTRGHLDLLVESVDFLKRLSSCSKEEMAPWLEKHKKNADAIASVLAAISREAASIPSKGRRGGGNGAEEAPPPGDSGKGGVEKKGFALDENMLNLFNRELEQRVLELNQGILALESEWENPEILEGLMRAAHSVKGAARIVEIPQISRVAHALEDFFSTLQQKALPVNAKEIDLLLQGVDFFERLSQVAHNMVSNWIKSNSEEIEQFIGSLLHLPEELSRSPGAQAIPLQSLSGQEGALAEKLLDECGAKEGDEEGPEAEERKKKPPLPPAKNKVEKERKNGERTLRVSSKILNRLMGLAGESLVEAKWLALYIESLVAFKRSHGKLGGDLEKIFEQVCSSGADEKVQLLLQSYKEDFAECQMRLVEKITDLELFMQRQASLSDRLYSEVISTRMRPFNDGIEGFPRLVRELAKQLHKKAILVVEGKNTPVDREILEKLEAPLNHLIRNAIDHGIEPPKERYAKGKSEVGTITIEVSHRAGMLSITVSDDGRGVEIPELKKKIVEKGLVTEAMSEQLSDQELLEFMFLPGFSTREELTELSGRGIGLNVVQNMVHDVGGTLKATACEGLSFHMQLPLTLSVIRALLVEISQEPYALPLARLKRVQHLPKEAVTTIKNRQYFQSENRNIGLIPAQKFLGLPLPKSYSRYLSVVVIGEGPNDYGVIVDRFLGEKELVVQELPQELGKVPDISGGAFMENGAPILIIDVEDMVRSIDKLLSKGSYSSIDFHAHKEKFEVKRKKILVVDDSITVREVESRLLESNGYHVDTAINGIDGWNAARVGDYDLIITDIDMPRMNGIEFVKTIRQEKRLKELPIVIVSYKERDGDKVAGLEAGANLYLTKSSFHDESLLSAVSRLIGAGHEQG